MRGPSSTWEDDHRLNIVTRSLGLGPVLFPDDGLDYGADLDLIRVEMSSRRPRRVALIARRARPASSRRLCCRRLRLRAVASCRHRKGCQIPTSVGIKPIGNYPPGKIPDIGEGDDNTKKENALCTKY